MRGIVDENCKEKIQLYKKNRRIHQLVINLSNDISSNIGVVIVSVIIFFVSIGAMRKVYKDIRLKLDIIPIEKKIVDLSHQIYGSSFSQESDLHKTFVELYLNYGKAILLSVLIIISVLLITYYIKKLIPLFKKRIIEQNGGV